jgi:hypothetical protein
MDRNDYMNKNETGIQVEKYVLFTCLLSIYKDGDSDINVPLDREHVARYQEQ